MPIDDIRKRYQAEPANLAEEVKRLRAENAQQKRDILELISEVERLSGEGSEKALLAEDSRLAEEELSQAGLAAVPAGKPRQPSEGENVKANVEAGRARHQFQTVRGLPITAEAFDTDYTGPR